MKDPANKDLVASKSKYLKRPLSAVCSLPQETANF